MSLTIIKGTILSAPTLGQLDALPGGYLVAEDGLIRGVSGLCPAVRRCPGGGLGRRADPPVLCGSAPPCAPVPHAGDGHGPAPAGLAERIRLSHRGPVRGHRLRPGDLQPPGPGACANGTTRVCMFSSLHTDATLI